MLFLSAYTLLSEDRNSLHVLISQAWREPLYLTDTPKLYLDDRSEDERKYPELFRQQLHR